jgi:hypothetical protein
MRTGFPFHPLAALQTQPQDTRNRASVAVVALPHKHIHPLRQTTACNSLSRRDLHILG